MGHQVTNAKIAALIESLRARPATASDHASACDLSPDSVRRMLKALEGRNHVKPHGKGQSKRGIKPVLWGWA